MRTRSQSVHILNVAKLIWVAFNSLFQIMSFWSNAPWGFGSNGGRDGCVYNGPFGKHKWSLTNGECLKRGFNGKTFLQPDVSISHTNSLTRKSIKMLTVLRSPSSSAVHGYNKLRWFINVFTLQDKVNFRLILAYTLPVAFLIVGNPPDCIAVHKCLRIFSHKFTEFESTLRDTLHNNMHCRIGGKGGTMCTKQSANAPEFLLHHAFTDKLWADWQKKETRYKNAYFRGNIYLYGISPRLRPQNLLDLSKQPGGVCVIYDDPPHENYKLCHDNLARLTLAEIDAIPRQKFTRLSSLEFDLFMVKKKGRARANEELKSLGPKSVLSKSAKLNFQDNKLGFKVKDVKEAVERKRKKKREEVITKKGLSTDNNKLPLYF